VSSEPSEMTTGGRSPPHTPGGSEAEGPSGDFGLAVGSAIDGLRSARLRVHAPLLLGFIMLFDSWDSVVIAYVLPSLMKEWGIGPAAAGLLMSSGYAGQFIGAILLGRLAERFGRMPVFKAAVLVMSVFALVSSVCPGYNSLLISRFIQGIAIGGALPVSITYINELAPKAIRGRYFAAFQFITISGYAVTAAASAAIIPAFGWRPMFALGALPLLLIPFVGLLLPESPRWLASRGRIAQTNKALVKLGGQAITVNAAAGTVQTVSPSAKPSPFGELFQPIFVRRTVTLSLLWFVTSYVSFGIITWIPSIYVTKFHMEIGESLRYSAVGTFIFVMVIPAVALIIDRVGRRQIAITGSLMSALAFAALASQIAPGIGAIVAMVMIGQFFTAGVSVILWPYTAENYPTSVRATAMGWASSLGRAAALLTPLAVGGLLALTGSIHIVFVIFAVLALIATLIWWLVAPETAKIDLDMVH
jgi:MFS transporter, putative metabolite:H+ symporter